MVFKGTVKGNTNGIIVGTFSKVSGSNSGIYIAGTVGHIGKTNETNSTYGIY